MKPFLASEISLKALTLALQSRLARNEAEPNSSEPVAAAEERLPAKPERVTFNYQGLRGESGSGRRRFGRSRGTVLNLTNPTGPES